MECFGKDPITGRNLYLVEAVSSKDVIADGVLPSPHLVCLVVWHAQEASADEIGRLAAHVLAAGAVYICAWGTDCERVHDVVDEVLTSEPGFIPVITTWHASESLDDAVFHFLQAARPDPMFADAVTSSVAIVIGASEAATQVRTRLRENSVA